MSSRPTLDYIEISRLARATLSQTNKQINKHVSNHACWTKFTVNVWKLFKKSQTSISMVSDLQIQSFLIKLRGQSYIKDQGPSDGPFSVLYIHFFLSLPKYSRPLCLVELKTDIVTHNPGQVEAQLPTHWLRPSSLFQPRLKWTGGSCHAHLSCTFIYKKGMSASELFCSPLPGDRGKSYWQCYQLI